MAMVLDETEANSLARIFIPAHNEPFDTTTYSVEQFKDLFFGCVE
jgi:hypothetical protein